MWGEIAYQNERGSMMSSIQASTLIVAMVSFYRIAYILFFLTGHFCFVIAGV